MNGEINVNITRSTAHGEYGAKYSTKHEPYEARIVLGRVYEGCTGWEQKFPSRPTFGCLAECMKGA